MEKTDHHSDHCCHSHPTSTKQSDRGNLKDPVCSMTVTPQSEHQASHDGQTYYFCSAGYQKKFQPEPDKYLHRHTDSNHVDTLGSVELSCAEEYTCPMHPEILQDHPGNCPKCGMALEPVMPTLEEDNSELEDFQRRFWWGLPFTLAVFVLAMFGHRLAWFDMQTQSWIELVLSLPVVLWAGWPFFVRAWQSIIQRSPNMWTLIGLGTGAAFIYSVVATIAPQVFPSSLYQWDG